MYASTVGLIGIQPSAGQLTFTSFSEENSCFVDPRFTLKQTDSIFDRCAQRKGETTADALRAEAAGRLRMAHSATARLMTQPAPINSALPNSLGGPAISSPAIPVSTCVPAPSPIA